MRRKPIPQPIQRSTSARSLAPASATSRLPTAAALAIALASLGGCASRGEEVQADPVAVKAAPIVTAAPTASAPGLNAIDPEPHAIAGEPAIVAPTPSVSAAKTAPTAVPTGRPHRTGGVPARVHPIGPSTTAKPSSHGF